MDPHGYFPPAKRPSPFPYNIGYTDSQETLPSTEARQTSCGECRFLQYHDDDDNITCAKGMCPMTPCHRDRIKPEFWEHMANTAELCPDFELDIDTTTRVYTPRRPPRFSKLRYERLLAQTARVALVGWLSPAFEVPPTWKTAYDNLVRHHEDVGSEADPVHSDH